MDEHIIENSDKSYEDFLTLFQIEERRSHEGLTSEEIKDPKFWWQDLFLIFHEPIRVALREMEKLMEKFHPAKDLLKVQRLYLWFKVYLEPLVEQHFLHQEQIILPKLTLCLVETEINIEEKDLQRSKDNAESNGVNESISIQDLEKILKLDHDKVMLEMAQFWGTCARFQFDEVNSLKPPESPSSRKNDQALVKSKAAFKDMKKILEHHLKLVEQQVPVLLEQHLPEVEYKVLLKAILDSSHQHILDMFFPWIVDAAQIWMPKESFKYFSWDVLPRDYLNFMMANSYEKYLEENRAMINLLFEDEEPAPLTEEDVLKLIGDQEEVSALSEPRTSPSQADSDLDYSHNGYKSLGDNAKEICDFLLGRFDDYDSDISSIGSLHSSPAIRQSSVKQLIRRFEGHDSDPGPSSDRASPSSEVFQSSPEMTSVEMKRKKMLSPIPDTYSSTSEISEDNLAEDDRLELDHQGYERDKERSGSKSFHAIVAPTPSDKKTDSPPTHHAPLVKTTVEGKEGMKPFTSEPLTSLHVPPSPDLKFVKKNSGIGLGSPAPPKKGSPVDGMLLGPGGVPALSRRHSPINKSQKTLNQNQNQHQNDQMSGLSPSIKMSSGYQSFSDSDDEAPAFSRKEILAVLEPQTVQESDSEGQRGIQNDIAYRESLKTPSEASERLTPQANFSDQDPIPDSIDQNNTDPEHLQHPKSVTDAKETNGNLDLSQIQGKSPGKILERSPGNRLGRKSREAFRNSTPDRNSQPKSQRGPERSPSTRKETPQGLYHKYFERPGRSRSPSPSFEKMRITPWQLFDVALEVQSPWGQKLLRGEKRIELRRYPLPQALVGRKFLLVQSPKGIEGASSLPDVIEAGAPNVEVIGTVIFTDVIEYTTEKSLIQDQHLHLVPRGSAYGWLPGKTLAIYGWVVGHTKMFIASRPVPSLDRQFRSIFKVQDSRSPRHQNSPSKHVQFDWSQPQAIPPRSLASDFDSDQELMWERYQTVCQPFCRIFIACGVVAHLYLFLWANAIGWPIFICNSAVNSTLSEQILPVNSSISNTARALLNKSFSEASLNYQTVSILNSTYQNAAYENLTNSSDPTQLQFFQKIALHNTSTLEHSTTKASSSNMSDVDENIFSKPQTNETVIVPEIYKNSHDIELLGNLPQETPSGTVRASKEEISKSIKDEFISTKISTDISQEADVKHKIPSSMDKPVLLDKEKNDGEVLFQNEENSPLVLDDGQPVPVQRKIEIQEGGNIDIFKEDGLDSLGSKELSESNTSKNGSSWTTKLGSKAQTFPLDTTDGKGVAEVTHQDSVTAKYLEETAASRVLSQLKSNEKLYFGNYLVGETSVAYLTSNSSLVLQKGHEPNFDESATILWKSRPQKGFFSNLISFFIRARPMKCGTECYVVVDNKGRLILKNQDKTIWKSRKPIQRGRGNNDEPYIAKIVSGDILVIMKGGQVLVNVGYREEES